MRLFINCKSHDAIHGIDFLSKFHTMLNGFVPILSYLFKTLLCIFKKCVLLLFTYKLLLQLLVLLKKEMEGILQVLVAINENFIILADLINEIFDEEEVVRVKWRQLYRSKVSPVGLSSFFRCLDKINLNPFLSHY